jgi:DNA-binding transcriptional LysR family regulator
VLAAAREAGLEIRIVRSAVSPAEALALVSTGVGLYRLPSSAAQPHPGVVYRELEGARSRLVLVRRPEPPSPAIAAICQLAGELFSDTPDASNDGLTGLDLSPAAA